MYQLEKYRGTKSRHICPSCAKPKVFVRYIITDTGEYLADTVGRCNRESNCSYHYTPKQYFADNDFQGKTGSLKKSKKSKNTNFAPVSAQRPQAESKGFDYLENSHILNALTDYEQNSFVQFLLKLFPGDLEIIWQAVKNYLIGTYNGFTVFPRISFTKKICTAKLMKFNPETGKRLKTDYSISSLPYELKRAGKLKDDFETDKSVFFGEHLAREDKQKPIAIVEAEKTAVIGSICISKFIWLACGSKQFLKVEKLKRLRQRQIILYPDADGFAEWNETAQQARFEGLQVKISDLIEKSATGEEKEKQFDLADYLINEANEINEFNEYADLYNAALERVQTDKSLMCDFDTILDEQKSILVIDGGLSESEAENQIRDFNNLRRTVLSLAE